MKRIGVVAILLLAFCGLADSIYLAQHQVTGAPLICNVQNFTDCNIVANSPYAYLFGIPLAQYGVLFYSILFVLAALELVLFDRILRRFIQGAAIIGLLGSLYFEAVQVFLIGALCIYCLASAIISLAIFIFATLIEPMRKREDFPPSSDMSDPAEIVASTAQSQTTEETRLPMPPTA